MCDNGTVSLVMPNEMPNEDQSMFSRIKAIFHYNRFIPDAHFPERLPAPFHSIGFTYAHESGVTIHFNDEEEAARVRAFCIELFGLVDESPWHPAQLDRKFSELLECDYQPTGNSSPFRDEPSLDLEHEIPKRTLQLLNRLPEIPLELPGLPNDLPSVYFSQPPESQRSQARSWDDLRVASYMSSNVIRVAMCTIIHPWISKGKLSEFINHIAALLDSAAQASSAAKVHGTRCKWFVVRAFLWTSWQRTVMIYFSFLLALNLDSGVDDGQVSRAVFLQSFAPISGMSLQEMSKRYATLGKSHYMCAWAFELLRKNPVCMSMDFRRFHGLYASYFDHYPARCMPLGKTSCKGDHPHSCQRFVGMVIRDQSAHDRGCLGCDRLMWDEASYRSTSGAKAVSLENAVGNKLRYRTASKKTLAISHVWSHGQGGRPETGMNHCLHQRYKTIAGHMGCDSYWMDTPCIPTDHILRREAIMNINKIFAQSRATLVCDRDLMEIEIEEDTSVELCELLLVTSMTCDWNIRAWTFLEAFRARQSIHLLCRDNKTVSLKETVETVHCKGKLDIGALLLTVPHLLPRVRRLDGPDISLSGVHDVTREIMRRNKPLSQGFLTVENSGMFLSHRPASRPGDDIVIWSLLLDEKVYENAIDFWRGRQGHSIHTSFLVSTTPRINIWRLGWAPASPRIFHNDSSAASAPRSMGINDTTSEMGLISAEGLKANWLFSKLGRLTMTASKLPLGRKALQVSNIRTIRKNFLQGYQWGALLRPVKANEPMEYIPATNQEDVSRILVVVCGTNDYASDDTAWEWKGVYEWDLSEHLPTFTYKEQVLLV